VSRTDERHDVLRWQIGGVTITSVVETESPAPVHFMFGGVSVEQVFEHEWLRPHFVDERGRLISRVQLLIVESQGKRIVVDTCIGNDKVRTLPAWNMRSTPFLEWMTAAGFAPSAIDVVACTHLHVDHVGWNTMLVDGRWVPTFPNARYVFGLTEFEHWRDFGEQDIGDVFGDSVAPIFDAGLAELVAPFHMFTDEVSFVPTPGHTPGHQSVRIVSEGMEAIITGDLMHHPIQCASPSMNSNFDASPAAAESARRSFLADHADRDVLVIGTHFAAPTAGRVVSHGDAYRFAV
jgi:glyoxylase-like metal-dependent hydrolase (beta-lactamase superfamily II)